MAGPPLLGISLTVARERMTSRHPAGVSPRVAALGSWGSAGRRRKAARPRPEGTAGPSEPLSEGWVLPRALAGSRRAQRQPLAGCAQESLSHLTERDGLRSNR